MKVRLMFRDRDFDFKSPSLATHPYQKVEPPRVLPNEDALTQDLELNTVFNAMAGGDRFLFEVARQAVLSGLQNDLETILYRQSVLKDTLDHYAIVAKIYDLAVAAIEHEKRRWWGIFSKNYPSGTLHSAVELVQMFLDKLSELKRLADEHAGKFDSQGFKIFFAMLKAELADDYFAEVRAHLKELRFNHGVLISAQLGAGNEGTGYVLRELTDKKPWWFRRMFPGKGAGYTFSIDPRDDAGARALEELQGRGINLVANALAQSADHILSFFVILRTELAFYLGCANLHRQLEWKKVATCFPVPAPVGTRTQSCVELRDAGLALTVSGRAAGPLLAANADERRARSDAPRRFAGECPVVGNDLNADGKKLCIITGANQGGKSTFLRAVGLAQLMMQCGMFVAAKSFSADVCRGLFTHYKREEDVTMASGKFDEELARMSGIVDALTPDSLLLFNESFAATNEREGSEIASQIVRTLLDSPVKIFFVTHLYDFASRFQRDQTDGVLFLRAERQSDGTRTFKLLTGLPLETSYGEDLYAKIFSGEPEIYQHSDAVTQSRKARTDQIQTKG